MHYSASIALGEPSAPGQEPSPGWRRQGPAHFCCLQLENHPRSALALWHSRHSGTRFWLKTLTLTLTLTSQSSVQFDAMRPARLSLALGGEGGANTLARKSAKCESDEAVSVINQTEIIADELRGEGRKTGKAQRLSESRTIVTNLSQGHRADCLSPSAVVKP